MVSGGRQILGLAVAIIGFVGSIITCVFPPWKVIVFTGAYIVTTQVIWEGLWMSCVTQSTGHMQCKMYDPDVTLSQDIQAARALVILAIIVGVFGILLGILSKIKWPSWINKLLLKLKLKTVVEKCISFMEDKRQKSKVAIASGVVFITAGLLLLIPVCWSANTIIHDFYNPLRIDTQKTELGASLYIGWGSAGLLFLGGGILCNSCHPRDEKEYDVKYAKACSVGSSRA